MRGRAAVYGFVQSDDGFGVGAGDDKEIVFAAGLDGGAYAFEVFAALDNALVAHMAAALGPDLVFEKTAGGAGVD